VDAGGVCVDFPSQEALTLVLISTPSRRAVDSPAYGVDHKIYTPVAKDVSEAAVAAWLPGFLERRAWYQRQVEERQAELEVAERELAIATRMLTFADRILKGTKDAAAPGIDGLPVELWERIFSAVDSDLRPLTLVSRRWRGMLVNGPLASRWNPVVFGEGNAERWELLKFTWVKTSRTSLVRFVISNTSLETVRAILSAERLQRLTIADWYGAGEAAEAVRAMVNETLGRLWPKPKIEELVLEGYGLEGSGERGVIMSALPTWAVGAPPDARRLIYTGSEGPSKLVLDGMITPEDDLSVCRCGVDSYTEMRTVRMGGRLPKAYIESFVDLRILRLEGVLPPSKSFGQAVLPRLTELHLFLEWEMVDHGDIRGAVFESLDCPSLVTVRVRAERDSSAIQFAISSLVHADLTSFLTRTGSIQTLELGLPAPFTAADLERHIRACPQLLELHVSIPHAGLFSARLFNVLSDLSVAPLLKTIKIAPKGGGEWRKADGVGFLALEAACEARFGEALECLDLRPSGERRVGTKWIERWDGPMTRVSGATALLKMRVRELAAQNMWNIII
jgi:hypothetical protein